MAGYKSKKKSAEDKLTNDTWPKIIQGSHSIRREYEDGRVEFESDWDALVKDVGDALAAYEAAKPVEEPTKRTRKKKV